MPDFFQWLYDLSISQWVREGEGVFPTLLATHIYSMAILIAVTGALDLRLLGLRFEPPPGRPISDFASRALRRGWVVLAAHALSGTILFLGKAVDYYGNTAFRIKMSLVLVAVLYHWVVLPAVARRADAASMRIASGLAGVIGLLLWISVVFAARMIAYV